MKLTGNNLIAGTWSAQSETTFVSVSPYNRQPGTVQYHDATQAVIDTAVGSEPDVRRMLLPNRPVAVFAASNFPLAFGIAGGDTASAFAAGCPVVAKAHSSQPGTAEMISTAINKAVEAAGFPAGFFSMIQANDHGSGQTLVLRPQIAAVGFTGSLGGGCA